MASTRDHDFTDDKNIVLGLGEVCSVNISEKKGMIKTPVKKAVLLKSIGIQNDAHSSPEDETRQVSFLAFESIERQNQSLKEKMINIQKAEELSPGAFAENITIKGIASSELMLNDIIEIEGDIVLEISRMGKKCHSPCNIFYQTGDCIMPREGFFARVIEGGVLYPGAAITITRKTNRHFNSVAVEENKEFEVFNGA